MKFKIVSSPHLSPKKQPKSNMDTPPQSRRSIPKNRSSDMLDDTTCAIQ